MRPPPHLSRTLLFVAATLALTFAIHGYLTREPAPWGPAQISPDGRFELVMLAKPGLIPNSLLKLVGRSDENPDGYLVLRHHETHQEIRRAFRQALASRLPFFCTAHWGKGYVAVICDDDPFWSLPK